VHPIAGRSQEWKRVHLRTVFASSGFAHVAHVKPRAHREFRIGYIGTVDYCKMHPDYLRMHSSAEIPGAQTIVCGGGQDQLLREEVRRLNVAERFEIRGHVRDVGEVLSTLDVFGYPLQPCHYGASELALLEAMAAGVVPVVLNNDCESYIVADGHTGIVAADSREFTRGLEHLHRQPHVRRRMAENARKEVSERFHVGRTVESWRALYEEVVALPKTERALADGVRELQSGYDLFQFAMADAAEGERMRLAHDDHSHADEYLSGLGPIFRGASNGSVFQYSRFFPDDTQLRRLCELVRRASTAAQSAA
jgi:hypothetical protein